MTMPIERVTVTCPKCGHEYQTSYRGSFNLSLGEDFDEEYMHQMTHGICPSCKHEVDLGALTVRKDGVFEVRKGGATRRTTRK